MALFLTSSSVCAQCLQRIEILLQITGERGIAQGGAGAGDTVVLEGVVIISVRRGAVVVTGIAVQRVALVCLA